MKKELKDFIFDVGTIIVIIIMIIKLASIERDLILTKIECSALRTELSKSINSSIEIAKIQNSILNMIEKNIDVDKNQSVLLEKIYTDYYE